MELCVIGGPAGVKGLLREACDFLAKLKEKQEKGAAESEGGSLFAVALLKGVVRARAGGRFEAPGGWLEARGIGPC